MNPIFSPHKNKTLVANLKSRFQQSKETDIFTREEVEVLLDAHEIMSRRLDRIVRISDGYQYELKDTTKALQEALAKVKILSGLIPICAACKKVRSVDGYWKQIEQYIAENSDADISHGLCPECAQNYKSFMDLGKKATYKTDKEASLKLTEEDLNHPVVAQYLNVINNKHFFRTPLYDHLVKLLRNYIKLERRMQRIVRISDMYQMELFEIRKKFEKEAKIDYLTGLASRREMYRIIEIEIKRISRYEGTFALIMFDFDQFKTINDKYGHEAGDMVLQKAAQLIRNKLRQQDVCARWGGEEFLIIQPEADANSVIQCSERLRKAIADNPMPFGPVEINVTISSGVALYRKGEKTESCIDRADKSLYAAKEAGRNRVGPLEEAPG